MEIAIHILQAPTGSAASAALAGAVSEAGGLGALALSWTTPTLAKVQVEEVQRLTKRRFQINFVLAFPPVALAAAMEAGAPVVSFSWGLPDAQVSLVKSFGATMGIQISNPTGARRSIDLGRFYHAKAWRPVGMFKELTGYGTFCKRFTTGSKYDHFHAALQSARA